MTITGIKEWWAEVRYELAFRQAERNYEVEVSVSKDDPAYASWFRYGQYTTYMGEFITIMQGEVTMLFWHLIGCKVSGHRMTTGELSVGEMECGAEDIWCERCGSGGRVYHS